MFCFSSFRIDVFFLCESLADFLVEELRSAVVKLSTASFPSTLESSFGPSSLIAMVSPPTVPNLKIDIRKDHE